MFIPDSYDAWEAHERQQQKELERLPVCDECQQPIQDDELYVFDDKLICPLCLANHKRWTEDYVQ